jgi:methylamine---glutamate N-methyltransferase subunit C
MARGFCPVAGPKGTAMSNANKVRWVCSVCGYVHEGSEPPDECPQCGADKDQFEREDGPEEAAPDVAADDDLSGYLSKWKREDDSFETRLNRIQGLAVTGKSATSPMRTQCTFPSWDDVLFRGAQLARMPLNEDVPVTTRTVIGKNARHPMVLDMPFYVSHMSFGALSREAKIALARGSRLTGTAIGSGEGGLLDDERREAGLYIYELGTAPFSHRDDAIRQGDAVEIKIGQAAKPGLGGHLPKDKVTDEIARIRGLEPGQDSVSPGRHHGIDSVADLRRRVDELRALTDGKPVGIKITAGHIEDDLACCLEAGPDFITIDCRGGGTGSSPTFVKDNVCLPPVYALHRARTFLDKAGSDVTLCVTGGFRDSTDIAKALAMGADAVALATASLIAIGCQQYRVCHTGKCPVGITTQNPDLRKRFDIEKSTERLVRFYTATTEELRVLARINGRDDVHALRVEDLLTLSREISEHTGIAHA